MFSVEFFNGILVLTPIRISRFTFFSAERLKKLAFQALKKDCTKLVVNFEEIRQFDPGAIEILKKIQKYVQTSGIEFVLTSVNSESSQLIREHDPLKELAILEFHEIAALNSAAI